MPVHLDARMQACVDMIPKCGTFADVGCDHGRLGVYLLQQERINKLVAVDVSGPSLQKCEQLLQKCELSDKAITLLGDGLAPIEDTSVDGAAICGMGGALMARMLEKEKAIAKRLKFLVLQPMRSQTELRQYLCGANYCIQSERLAFSNGRMYHVLRVTVGEPHAGDDINPFSHALLRGNDPLLGKAVDMAILDCEGVLGAIESKQGENACMRREELQRQIEWFKMIQQKYVPMGMKKWKRQ